MMNPHVILFPVVVYVLWMAISAVYMFSRRLRAVQSREVPLKYFRTQTTGTPPNEKIIAIAKHYDNQFQLPILFFITCLAYLQVGRVDLLTLVLTWLFVASRGLHSFIFLTSNNVTQRAAAFGVGWALMTILWIRLGILLL